MDVPAPSNRAGCNGSIGSPSDDPYSAATMMNFDVYSELCSSPSLTDQLFSLLNDSSAHQMFAIWPSLGSSPRQSGGISEDMQLDAYSIEPGLQKTDLVSLANPAETGRVPKSSGELGSDSDPQQGSTSLVPRPVSANLLADRMLMALHLFRESLGSGVLAQVWMPIEQEGHVVLSTCEQPFLLDQALAGYREVSRNFVFSAKEETGLHPGVPGRVFISGVPEWTSNVLYYSKPEYLRMEYAVRHDVRGSLAMPIYDPSKGNCCAVLELITRNEKPDFDAEMDNLRQALQAVNLKTTRDCSNEKFYSENQKAAFTEILDVLRAICHAHMLPLALTWVPTSTGSRDGVVGQESVFDSQSGKALLSIHKSACYVNDAKMQSFFHACAESHLEKGQGIVGRALKSNLPFFSPNIREYNIKDYPLAHHARKFGLHAAVAIRLRSTYTGDADYILEFFLPVNCTGSEEQQMLLNNLSSTMQRICKSLRTVSEAEVGKVDPCTSGSCLPSGHSESSCNQPVTEKAFQDLSLVDKQGDMAEQSSSARLAEKKRSTAEKNIGMDVLRKYFSGSLKDAAKSLGVCPTTLKRICRQHGITRWPSRKINKVNRSLKKIQTVINSVHGVDSSLQYDPATGSLVPAETLSEKTPFPSLDALSSPSIGKSADEKSGPKSEQGYSPPDGWERESCQLQLPDAQKADGDEFHMQTSNYSGNGNLASYGANITDHFNSEGTQGPLYPTGAVGSLHHKEPGCISPSVFVFPSTEATKEQIVGRNSPSVQEADVDMFGDHEGREHTHPSTSGMTDSSSGSASSHPTFKKNPAHPPKDKSSPALTVKATYNGDTVRFKFMPSLGWHHLLEEIAKRFKLSTEVFQVKYKDDEDEWVIMANESDLQECVDVMDSMGTRNVKLQVRDLPCLISSSGSSSCLQLEGHKS